MYEFRQTMPTEIKAVHQATKLVFRYRRIQDEGKARRTKKRLSDFFFYFGTFVCVSPAFLKQASSPFLQANAGTQSPLFVFKNGAINCGQVEKSRGPPAYAKRTVLKLGRFFLFSWKMQSV